MKYIYLLRMLFAKKKLRKPTPEDKKRHIEKALDMMQRPEMSEFIEIEYPIDQKGVPPRICFTIQSDPVSEVGVNGCQAEDMIEYVRNLVKSLDSAIPCDENKQTIQHLNGALQWQVQRTNQRKYRGVEGKYEE